MTEILRRESEFLLYQAEDGRTRIEVRFDGETTWLTQAALAELYQTTPQNITQHIAAICQEGELDEAAAGEVARAIRARGGRGEAAAADVRDPRRRRSRTTSWGRTPAERRQGSVLTSSRSWP